MSSDETAASDTATDNSGSAGKARPPSPAQSGALSRIVNWFWRSEEMRACLQPASSGFEVLRLRASLCADIARRTEDSAEPFEGSVDAVLCDLYRQSIFWSRAALAVRNGGDPNAWSQIDPTLQNRAVPNPETLQRVQSVTDSGSFQDLALLPDNERLTLLPSLRALALALLAELEIDKRSVDALWTQRIVRIGLLVALLGALAMTVLKASEGAEKSHDLAAGKAWRVSSQNGGVSACTSPEQECSQSPDFFFHTNEELRPWVEIDLGSSQRFSAVRVENRKDCCSERAAPMVVEVSSDQKNWRTVAKREFVFNSWLAKFAPLSARYVRLRLEKRESLHLQRVRVLP